MTGIEQFLSDRLREVLTVFDPVGRLLEVARSSAAEKCAVIEVADDIITAREQALEVLAGLG